jgi:aldose 1-epimerase
MVGRLFGTPGLAVFEIDTRRQLRQPATMQERSFKARSIWPWKPRCTDRVRFIPRVGTGVAKRLLPCSIALSLVVVVSTAKPSHAETSSNPNPKMSIERSDFGKTNDGEAVELYTIENANGLVAKVITYGAIIYSLEVPDKNGRLTNVNANCASLADYETKSPCFGAVLGRYANRIAGGQFMLEGHRVKLTLNASPNHIHGGVRGFHKRVWKAEPVRGSDFVGVKLTYLSKDGEEGYPGNLVCTVTYELNNRNEWKMDYRAQTDKTTVINLSNHSYWNLAGAQSGTILGEVLTINANKYLLADDALIPTGEIVPVDGTPVDFRKPHPIGERINDIKEKQFGGGYDHCLVVNHPKPGGLDFCAKLTDPVSGRTMEVSTTQPGVQIFTANFQSGAFSGPGGYAYPRHLGVCLETQHFPNSPNEPRFPSTVLHPGQAYHEVTLLKFGVEK